MCVYLYVYGIKTNLLRVHSVLQVRGRDLLDSPMKGMLFIKNPAVKYGWDPGKFLQTPALKENVRILMP